MLLNMLDGREVAASVSRAMAGSRLWTDLPGTRIFCLILAGDHEWGVKQEVVKQTWAQRCDNYCFFYSVSSRPFYFFFFFFLYITIIFQVIICHPVLYQQEEQKHLCVVGYQ